MRNAVEWWKKDRRNDLLPMLYCFSMAVAGAVGLFWYPAKPLAAMLGALTNVYSAALFAAGIVGVLVIYVGFRRTEIAIFLSFAMLTLLHAFITFAATDQGGDQTGWRLIASSIGSVALASTRWQRGLTRSEIENHLPGHEVV